LVLVFVKEFADDAIPLTPLLADGEVIALLPDDEREAASRRVNIFKMGRGIGHFAVLSFPSARLASSASFSAAAANRKLKLKASSDGQDFARSIRRTARFEALFSDCVNEIVWGEFLLSPLEIFPLARERETSPGAIQ